MKQDVRDVHLKLNKTHVESLNYLCVFIVRIFHTHIWIIAHHLLFNPLIQN